jgi:hypothetical protein
MWLREFAYSHAETTIASFDLEVVHCLLHLAQAWCRLSIVNEAFFPRTKRGGCGNRHDKRRTAMIKLKTQRLRSTQIIARQREERS